MTDSGQPTDEVGMSGFWRKLLPGSETGANYVSESRRDVVDRETANASLDLLRSISRDASETKDILVHLSNQIADRNPESPAQSGNNGIFRLDPDGVSAVVVNPSVDCGELAKQVLRLMSPKDAVGASFVRVGNEYDGGYVMVDHGLSNTIAYSFGINDDVSWDQGMVDRGCEIFQFDHTIDALPYENAHFHWSKLGIGSVTDGEFISVRDIIERNSHNDKNNIILKMDIEGAEWSVFEGIDSDDLRKFSQIVVELHSFVTGGEEHLKRVIPILEKINQTHQSVHYHANNWSWLGILGGVSLPDVFELTFVRKDEHQFAPCSREFPTPLDRACRVGAPDYFLKL